MHIAKILVVLGMICIAGVVLYASLYGDFRQEGSLLFSIPWGIVTLVDLYVGFTLFSGWILYREQSWLKTGIWIVAIMFLGFLVGCLYTFIALHRSQGNWKQFWLGKHWKES